VWLDLVGIRIDLSESDQATRDFALRELSEFVVEAGGEPRPTDLRLRAVTDPSLDPALGLRRPIPAREVEQQGDHWSFIRIDFEGALDVGKRIGELRYHGRVAMMNFLRLSLSVLLRPHRGALFHAASVQFGDGVLLFPGVSGTGKSTIASLAAPRGVLSDEISALRPWRGRIHAFPTPFWGDLPRIRAAPAGPLVGIVLLERDADVPAVTPGTLAEAIAALLEGAHIFDEEVPPPVMTDLVATARALASVPCHRLSFRLPSNPWPLLECNLRQPSAIG
jgi:hypothetical protein